MKTVHMVSELTGVSVRTLHHYDAIGLLKPTEVSVAGYRLYDDKALERLQIILLFKELQFSLKEIKEIMQSPGFDSREALKQQLHLLKLRQKQLSDLIALTEKIIDTGVNLMEFKPFSKTEIKAYSEEAKKKWGNTAAFSEYEKNVAEKTRGEQQTANDMLMLSFARLGKMKHLNPASDQVQQAVKELQDFITENYYTCTPQILACLGEMYVSDERFKQSIDNAGGEGTAEFVSSAIEAYCRLG